MCSSGAKSNVLLLLSDRYGRVQSVKVLSKNKEDEVNTNGLCATIAFIDIKSASKAHSGDNKVDERTLKTEYYEPISTVSSAIHIHERNETLARPPAAGTAPASHYSRSSSNSRYSHGIVDERGYERSSGAHYYLDRNSDIYVRRTGSNVNYHEDEVYQSRGRQRERYSSRNSTVGGTGYAASIERNQGLYRGHNSRQHYDNVQRYPSDQYLDERIARRAPVPNLCSLSSTSPRSSSGSRGGSRNRHRKQRHASPVNSASKSRSQSADSHSPGSVGSVGSVGSHSLSRGHSHSSGRSPSRSRSSSSSSGHRKNSRSSSSSRSSSRSPCRSGNSKSPSVCSTGRSAKVISTPVLTSPPISSIQESRPAGSVQQDSMCSTPESSISNINDSGKIPYGICVKNLPVRSTDSSLKDGLYHEYKKHGKVTTVKVIGQGLDRYAVVYFKKSDDVEKSVEVSKDKLFFGCKIEVTPHEGLDVEDNEFRPLEAHMDEYHPKATRTLFVGNLEKDVTECSLKETFMPFGDIIDVDIKHQGPSIFAFIQYSDISAVSKAIRKLDGEHLGANRMNLGFGKSMPTHCLWLDGLSDSVTEKSLNRHLSRFGPVKYAVIDKQMHRALVCFEAVEYAQAAVPELRGRSGNGKKVQIKNAFTEIMDECRMKVDFASIDCQRNFLERMKSSGQMEDHEFDTFLRRIQEYDQRDERSSNSDLKLSHDMYNHTGNYNRFENQPQRTLSSGTILNSRHRLQRSRATQSAGGRFEHEEFERRNLSYDENSSLDTPNNLEGLYDQDGRDAGYKQRRENSVDMNNHLKCKPAVSPSSDRSGPVSRTVSLGSSSFEKPNHIDGDRKYGDGAQEERLKPKCPVRHRPVCDRDILLSPLGQCSSPASSTKEKIVPSPDSSHPNSLHSSNPCLIECTDHGDVNLNSDLNKDIVQRRFTSVDLIKTDLNCEVEKIRNASKHSLDSSLYPKNRKSYSSADAQHSNRNESDHIERKKRLLLASHDRTPVRTKDLDQNSDAIKNENGIDVMSDTDTEKHELVKNKPKSDACANSDLKNLQKTRGQILQELQLLGDDGISSSDHENNENESDNHKSKRHKLMRTKFGEIVVSCQHQDPMPLRKEPLIISSERAKDPGSIDFIDPRIGKLKSHERLLKVSSPNFSQTTGLLKTLLNSERLKRPPLERAMMVCKTDDEDEMGGDSVKSVSHNDLLTLWRKKSSHSTNEMDSKYSHIHQKPKYHLIKFPSEPGYRFVSDATLMKKKPMSLPLPPFAAEWLSTQNNLNKLSPKDSFCEVTSPKLKSPSSSSPHIQSSSSEFKSIKLKPPPFVVNSENQQSSNPAIVVSPPPKDKNDRNLMSPPKPSLLSPPVLNKSKESVPNVDSSSDSEQSSPNRPSFEERIRALDEKFNKWSGSAKSNTPNVVTTPNNTNLSETSAIDQLKKRPRFTFLTSTEHSKEPSDIVKSLLAKSSIFDQDSKRLEHINEKYEPKDIQEKIKPATPKPFVRTKAAAKEFFSTSSSSLPETTTKISSPKLVSCPSNLYGTNISPSLSPPPTPVSSTIPAAPSLPAMSVPPYSPLTPISATEPLSYPSKRSLEPLICQKSTEIVPPIMHSNSCPNDKMFLPSSDHDCINSSLSHLKSPEHQLVMVDQVKSETQLTTVDENKTVQPIQKVKLETIKSEATVIKKEPTVIKSEKPSNHLSKSELVGTKLSHSIRNLKNSSSDMSDKLVVEIQENLHSNYISKHDEIKKEIEDQEIFIKKEVKPLKPIKIENPVLTLNKQDVHHKEHKQEGSGKRKLSLDSQKANKYDSDVKTSAEPDSKKAKLNNHSSSVSSIKERKHSGGGGGGISKSKSDKDRKSHSKLNNKNMNEKHRHNSLKESSKQKSIKENVKSGGSKFKGTEYKSEKKNHQENMKKKVKDKDRSDSNKNRKEPGKEKNSKTNKCDMDKFPENLHEFIDQPTYLSMYDKVKARSSQNQIVKDQNKDLDLVHKKFNKLKQTRARREEKLKSGDYDSSHQFSDEMSDISDDETTDLSHKLKKRKFVIESSTDSEIENQKVGLTSKFETKFDMSDSDLSDVDFSRYSSLQKDRLKGNDVFSSHSSDENDDYLHNNEIESKPPLGSKDSNLKQDILFRSMGLSSSDSNDESLRESIAPKEVKPNRISSHSDKSSINRKTSRSSSKLKDRKNSKSKKHLKISKQKSNTEVDDLESCSYSETTDSTVKRLSSKSLTFESYSHSETIDSTVKKPSSKSLTSESCSHSGTTDSTVKKPSKSLTSESGSHSETTDSTVKRPSSKSLTSESCSHSATTDSTVKKPSKSLTSESCSHSETTDSTVKRPSSKSLTSESCSHSATTDSTVKKPSKSLTSESCSHSETTDSTVKRPSSKSLTSESCFHSATTDSTVKKPSSKSLTSESCSHSATTDSTVKKPSKSLTSEKSGSHSECTDSTVKRPSSKSLTSESGSHSETTDSTVKRPSSKSLTSESGSHSETTDSTGKRSSSKSLTSESGSHSETTDSTGKRSSSKSLTSESGSHSETIDSTVKRPSSKSLTLESRSHSETIDSTVKRPSSKSLTSESGSHSETTDSAVKRPSSKSLTSESGSHSETTDSTVKKPSSKCVTLDLDDSLECVLKSPKVHNSNTQTSECSTKNDTESDEDVFSSMPVIEPMKVESETVYTHFTAKKTHKRKKEHKVEKRNPKVDKSHHRSAVKNKKKNSHSIHKIKIEKEDEPAMPVLEKAPALPSFDENKEPDTPVLCLDLKFDTNQSEMDCFDMSYVTAVSDSDGHDEHTGQPSIKKETLDSDHKQIELPDLEYKCSLEFPVKNNELKPEIESKTETSVNSEKVSSDSKTFLEELSHGVNKSSSFSHKNKKHKSKDKKNKRNKDVLHKTAKSSGKHSRPQIKIPDPPVIDTTLELSFSSVSENIGDSNAEFGIDKLLEETSTDNAEIKMETIDPKSPISDVDEPDIYAGLDIPCSDIEASNTQSSHEEFLNTENPFESVIKDSSLLYDEDNDHKKECDLAVTALLQQMDSEVKTNFSKPGPQFSEQENNSSNDEPIINIIDMMSESSSAVQHLTAIESVKEDSFSNQAVPEVHSKETLNTDLKVIGSTEVENDIRHPAEELNKNSEITNAIQSVPEVLSTIPDPKFHQNEKNEKNTKSSDDVNKEEVENEFIMSREDDDLNFDEDGEQPALKIDFDENYGSNEKSPNHFNLSPKDENKEIPSFENDNDTVSLDSVQEKCMKLKEIEPKKKDISPRMSDMLEFVHSADFHTVEDDVSDVNPFNCEEQNEATDDDHTLKTQLSVPSVISSNNDLSELNFDENSEFSNIRRFLMETDSDTQKSPSGSETEDKDLKDLNLKDPNLKDLNLKDPDLKDLDLKDPDLKDTDLKDPDLKDPDLKDTDLKDTDLKDPDLKDPDLKDPDLKDTDLKDTDLKDPDLKDGLIHQCENIEILTPKKVLDESNSTEKNLPTSPSKDSNDDNNDSETSINQCQSEECTPDKSIELGEIPPSNPSYSNNDNYDKVENNQIYSLTEKDFSSNSDDDGLIVDLEPPKEVENVKEDLTDTTEPEKSDNLTESETVKHSQEQALNSDFKENDLKIFNNESRGECTESENTDFSKDLKSEAETHNEDVITKKEAFVEEPDDNNLSNEANTQLTLSHNRETNQKGVFDEFEEQGNSDDCLKIVEDTPANHVSDSSPEEQLSFPRTRSRTSEPKTRRSRRAKGRKASPGASSEEIQTPTTPVRVSTRRQKPGAVEKVRRILRVEMNDIRSASTSNLNDSMETDILPDVKGELEDIDNAKTGEKVLKKEEVKRRKGRKKKSLECSSISPQPTSSTDSKDKEDVHNDETTKNTQKGNLYDVFEFRDSEDEDFGWEHSQHLPSLKDRLEHHEESTAELSTSENDQKSLNDVKHGKISITIRLPPKDNADGTSSGAPEVVKTSDGGRPVEESQDENSSVPVENESVISTVAQSTPTTPAKTTVRKSQRLLSKTTVDEVIEEVVRGNFVEGIELSPPCDTSVIRSTRSRTRSKNVKGETLTAPPTPPTTRSKSPKSEKLSEQKHHPVIQHTSDEKFDGVVDKKSNTTVSTIVANTENEITNTEKVLQIDSTTVIASKIEIEKVEVNQETEETEETEERKLTVDSDEKQVNAKEDLEDNPSSPDKVLVINELTTEPDNDTQAKESAENKEESALEFNSPGATHSGSASCEDEAMDKMSETINMLGNKVSLRSFRISRTSVNNEDKVEIIPQSKIPDGSEAHKPSVSEIPKNTSDQTILSTAPPCGPPPVMKVELPKVTTSNYIASSKAKPQKELKPDNEEENERSSPDELIDPVTGYLTRVTKSTDTKPELTKPVTTSASVPVVEIHPTKIVQQHPTKIVQQHPTKIVQQHPTKIVQQHPKSTPTVVNCLSIKTPVVINKTSDKEIATPSTRQITQPSMTISKIIPPSVQLTSVEGQPIQKSLVPPPPPLLRKIAAVPSQPPLLVKSQGGSLFPGGPTSSVGEPSVIDPRNVILKNPSSASTSTPPSIITSFSGFPVTTAVTPVSLLSPTLPQQPAATKSAVTIQSVSSASAHENVSNVEASKITISKTVNARPIIPAEVKIVKPPTTRGHSLKSDTLTVGEIKSGHRVNPVIQGPSPLTVYESNLIGPSAAGKSSTGPMSEILSNPQLLQHYKEFYATHHRLTSGAASPGGTLARSSIPITTLAHPTPPHTPTPPIHSVASQPDMQVAVNMQFRQPAPLHHLGRHPSDVNPYQPFMYASSYPSGIYPADFRVQQEAQARVAALGLGPARLPYPSSSSAMFTRHALDKQDTKKLESDQHLVKEKKPPAHSVIHDLKQSNDFTAVPSNIKEEKDSRSPSITPDITSRQQHQMRTGASHQVIESRKAVDIRAVQSAVFDARVQTENRPQNRHMHEVRQRKSNQPLDIRTSHYPSSSHDNNVLGSVVPIKNESSLTHLSVETQPVGRQNQDFHHAGMDAALMISPGVRPSHSGNQLRQLSPHIVHDHQPRCTDSPAVATVYHQMSAQQSRFMPPHQQRPAGLLTTVVPEKQPPPAHQASNLHRKTQPPSKIPKPKYVISDLDQARSIRGELPVITSTKSQSKSVIGNAIPPSLTPVSKTPPPAHAPSHLKHPSRSQPQPQTPPVASQVPSQGDPFFAFLQRFPLTWQGLLTLKNDQAKVQMHFISGNHNVALASLPAGADSGGIGALRIVQRMRLEQTQLEGVARRMQMETEHCMLLALPCGRDQHELFQQGRNLDTGFISYLQQKQAAGIVNVSSPGSQQPAYVVHIFPSCEFSSDVISKVAPEILQYVDSHSHLLIIIATV
ncbi:Protein split ends [Nymphon striatum]|nr:Protein split ends [Nymphon striatum]